MLEQDLLRIEIAKRLRTAREQAGLSQAQVAKLLQIHRPTVSEIEAGRRKVAAEELSAFADLYGVGVDWITGQDTDRDEAQADPVLVAARELGKLSQQDLDQVLDLLSSLKGARAGRPG